MSAATGAGSGLTWSILLNESLRFSTAPARRKLWMFPAIAFIRSKAI
jgi:hypothetical protein